MSSSRHHKGKNLSNRNWMRYTLKFKTNSDNWENEANMKDLYHLRLHMR